MPATEPRHGDPPFALEMLVRGVVHAFNALATLTLAGVFGIAALIAIGGTGGFTSDLPPEHPAWIGLSITLCLWAALQCAVIRLQRYLLAVVDKKFGYPIN